jgi:hypothetical protein
MPSLARALNEGSSAKVATLVVKPSYLQVMTVARSTQRSTGAGRTAFWLVPKKLRKWRPCFTQ